MDVTNLTAEANVFTANAYHVRGETTTLVDVGAMPGIDRKLDALDAVVLTHQHADHIQELETIVDAFDPEVYAAAAHPLRTHGIDDGDLLTIGDTVFEVVDTPGHAPDHVSFVSEAAIFSGDVVVYNDGAFDDGSFGRTDRPGQSRDQLIDSLEELLERLSPTVEWLYAGHGDIFQGDVQAVIERALYRASRREPKYPDE